MIKRQSFFWKNSNFSFKRYFVSSTANVIINDTFLNRLGKCRNKDDVVGLLRLKDKKEFNDIIIDRIFEKCYQINDTSLITRVLTMIRDKGLNISVESCNIVLDLLVKNDRIKVAYKLFYELSTNVNIANLQTFNILIKGCKSRGEYNIATKLWNLMKNKYKLIPINITYMLYIQVCSQSGKFEKGQQLYEECLMNNSDAIKDLYLYCTMINMYAMSRNKDKIEEMVTNMNINNIKYDNAIYGSLVKAYSRTHEYRKINQLIRDIKQNNISLNMHFYMHLSEVFSKKMEYIVMNRDCKADKYQNMLQKSYDILKKDIPNGCPLLLKDNKYIKLLMNALLWKNINDWNNIEVINWFSILLKQNIINIWYKESEFNQMVINLHNLSVIESKFILRYIFIYETDILQSLKEILILTGNGTHASIDQEYSMKESTSLEFISWNPVINILPYNDNAFINLDTKNVDRFIKKHNNTLDFNHKAFGSKIEGKLASPNI